MAFPVHARVSRRDPISGVRRAGSVQDEDMDGYFGVRFDGADTRVVRCHGDELELEVDPEPQHGALLPELQALASHVDPLAGAEAGLGDGTHPDVPGAEALATEPVVCCICGEVRPGHESPPRRRHLDVLHLLSTVPLAPLPSRCTTL